MSENLHAADPEERFRSHLLVRPGSPDLVDLYERQLEQARRPANDTGVGNARAFHSEPADVVLDVERRLSSGLVTADRLEPEDYPARVEEIAEEELRRLEDFWREALDGDLDVELF